MTTDFPIIWENSDDAKLFWRRDTVHEPRPPLPLTRTFGQEVIGAGADKVSATFDYPGSSRSIRVNGYTFSTRIAESPESTAAKRQRLASLMPRMVAELPRLWRDEYQPELERDLKVWRSFDLHSANFKRLVQHFEEAIPIAIRHWEIHFLTVGPIMEATGPLAKLMSELARDDNEQSPYRLLAGYPTKTTERDHALWRVYELARQSPVVVDAFNTVSPRELMPILRRMSDPEAVAFVRALEDYLVVYGDRGEGFFDEPTWREEPAFLLGVLKAYLAGARSSPQEELAFAASNREQFTQETLERIPPERRDEFMQVLDAAREVYPLRETHAFFIDQASVAQFRYIVVELGRRLAAMEVLSRPEDIFYLEMRELREIAANPAGANISALIANRRADHLRWSQLVAPAWIGTPPAEPVGQLSETDKFFRLVNTDLPVGRITELKGAAGSRGVARGPARVILQQAEFARLQPGDVLVCPTTFPPWTALYRIIAGLVTDSGGVLAHGAIVAREYGLPAVLGTGYGTRAIRDGQIIEVDGNKGVVKIID